MLYNWKAKVVAEQSGASLNADERAELLRIRKEKKKLRMEKDILKKGQRPPANGNQVTFKTIKQLSTVLVWLSSAK